MSSFSKIQDLFFGTNVAAEKAGGGIDATDRLGIIDYIHPFLDLAEGFSKLISLIS
ncbi:hypothetical protein G7Y29_09315 [Corynebacterium qintianiae]|uniref:Uncharacterized protein n=1 Tax=Corynebacterium qintianiae TaxID=2709392 RepID=A0A7T0PFP8_9CORY|nr:hypothetical protein [Corynebacterium qintianiae]QPK83027.1 hypothetical protein G7Y29_09315 [Corynebacterium qintianiae]